MTSSSHVRLLILVMAFASLAAAPALAQPDSNSHVRFDAGGLLPKKPPPGLPDVRPQPLAWPRLDPGAVLCHSQDDLQRLASRRAGGSVAGPIDCQVIRNPTPISILEKQGPGMTEVQTTNPAAGGTGWTDAWLPDRAPSH
ncbi:MAG TPA: hypothetical protein VHB27_12560 [Rhodopila sp.]|uniref:hypothetical protein n=1 Tax=Rhodopila sp. TaxID=2480087 RepID=UPI002CA60128|nr:hypothetical protein [Rhodopila sp.]HVY16050.1 hypothetical protein [Rhodopila sp.]